MKFIRSAVILLTLFSATQALAIPRFSLLTGTRCSACHFNPQGSGIRTTLGWEMMNETGMIKWHGPNAQDTFADPLPEENNTVLSRHLYWGGDARFQLVRESKSYKEMLIPMQLSGELAYQPSPELVAYTNINFASLYVRSLKNDSLFGSPNAGLYPGETDYDLALQYQPSQTLPSLRVGMIEPTVSIRQDDHTEFVHEEAGLQGIALIPPYYNEIGAELTYEGIRWLTVNAGIFNARNLSLIDPSIGSVTSSFDFSHPTFSARVMGWPQSLDLGLNGEIGGSVLMNGAFHMYNGFIGLGLADKSTIYLEGMYGKNADDRILRNFTVIGSMEIVQWLAAEWRYDYGQTELYAGRDLGFAEAFLFGLEYFPAPYIELRPEYRVFQKNPITGTGTFTGQWTGQIHIFY